VLQCDALTASVKLTVVLACRSQEHGSALCGRLLLAQRRPGVELILALDGENAQASSPFGSEFDAEFDAVVRVPGALVPELWAAGIRRAFGERVALLTDTVLPDTAWVDTFLAEDSGAAAVGGLFAPSRRRFSPVDDALLFCRYSRQLPPRPAPGADVAADNACYRRDRLNAVADSWEHGFWEPAVHAQLRLLGDEVVMLSAPTVRVAPGRSLRGFGRQRLTHGYEHARQQGANLGRAKLALRVAMAPLVPGILLFRWFRQASARRGLLLRFIVALPVACVFAACWAVGEARGYAGLLFGDSTRPTGKR
jgi:hypothetical protein